MTSAEEHGGIVKTALFAAFANTPYPGDKNIVVDQNVFDPECTEIVNAFTGMKWQDVSVEMVLQFKEALPLFTPAAFSFYLPAYMVACVDAYYDVDVALDSVLFNLTPPVSQSGWQWDFFQARIENFAGLQVDAIRSFLALMIEYELADWACEDKIPPRDRIGRAMDFWAQFPGKS